MSLSRVSSGLLNDQSIFYVNQNQTILSQLQEKLSSGKNINRPSDDPIGLTQLLSLSNNLRTNDRYTSNISSATSEVQTADTAMSSMVQLVQRAQELTTQAANFTNNQAGRNAIALEISQIIDQMVQLGNTQIGGRYIFGGFSTTQPPFTRANQYQVNYTGTPPTQPWQRSVEVSPGVTVNVNVNGQQMLGSSNGNPVGGPLPATVTGSGIFQTLTSLLIDLQASGDPNQLNEIRNREDNLSNDLTTISSSQATIGAISNRLSTTADRLTNQKTTLTTQYAGLQNIDTAKTIADLNYQQNIYQASLSVTARVLQTSLLDFLK